MVLTSHHWDRLFTPNIIISIFTASVFFLMVILAMGDTHWPGSPGRDYQRHGPTHIRYSTVTGYLMQDERSTDPKTFDYTATNFGLINRAYSTDKSFDPKHEKTQWERFQHFVQDLREKAEAGVDYKLIFMGRHGEGYHNVAEAFYGTQAWDCHWSKLPGNETSQWVDAHLTETGIQQAQVANDFWRNLISNHKIQTPQHYYVSPLARCLQTAHTSYSGLDLPEEYPFVPEIKELLRECIGIHTCDQRSSRSWIHENYPDWPIESGFDEEDQLWSPDVRETHSAEVARLTALLDDIFTHDDHTFLSFTSHSGAISAILTAIGHQPFSLNTGAVIPVIVKAERIASPAPSTSIEPWTSGVTCTVNPTATSAP